MHELVLSENIIRLALRVPEAGAGRLRAITVTVGALSGASLASLEFCMGIVLEQKGMAGVAVRLVGEPARARCACGEEYAAESLFEGCPACGGFQREIVAGRDVTLQSIEVEDGKDQA